MRLCLLGEARRVVGGCDVYLQPHAVVLDFMRPSVVLRRPVGLRRQARIDETGRCQWGSDSGTTRTPQHAGNIGPTYVSVESR